MGLNLTQKILKEHLVSGDLESGGEIGIKIDQVLTQDATGTMAYLQFESMGYKRIRCPLAVSYVDHNTIQVGSENADDHAYLRSAAARYGAIFSKPGNGICHQLHLERFGEPGKTLLGADSHTPTAGGLGMIGIGAGGIDVAVAMAGGPFHISVPKVIKIEITGSLKPWVSAKDVVLRVLEEFSTKGNVGCVFEYAGSGIAHLDVPERATITNMGAECGVTTSVFPSDEVTKKFLEAQGRGKSWVALQADEDADYDREITIDLSTITPLAATPHSPGDISSIASLQGKKVNQVLVGSCTNSSYRDLKMVAKILEGKHVHPDVEFGVAPGSRQVLMMLAKEGHVTTLLGAGARILENACGFCIGNSMSPVTDAVSLRTSNRNFEGRSGTPSADVYLVSPEIAAVAAINGRIVDPTILDGDKCPKVKEPKVYETDDALFLEPAKRGEEVEVVKGPNIVDVPVADPLCDDIDGLVTIKVGDKVTTDHIMPAGRRLKYRSNVPKYSEYVFEAIDPEFSDRARKNMRDGKHNVIVAGASYGQGSSREHAALCPMFLGVKAVLAKSIERIHRANLINFGILPFTFALAGDYDRIGQGDRITVRGVKDAVKEAGKAVARIEGDGMFEITLKLDLSDRERKILIKGGLLNSFGKRTKKA